MPKVTLTLEKERDRHAKSRLRESSHATRAVRSEREIAQRVDDVLADVLAIVSKHLAPLRTVERDLRHDAFNGEAVAR